MEVIVKVISELNNSVFGKFEGKYFGENQNLILSRQGNGDVFKILSNSDDIIIDSSPIQNKLEINKLYKVNSIASITAGNNQNNATVTILSIIEEIKPAL